MFAAKLNKYITLVYGVLNTTNNEFCYAVGGHYPNPILCDASGKARMLEGSGFPIGIMADVDYQVQTVLLQQGEYLVLFSMGLWKYLCLARISRKKNKAY